MLQYAYDGDDKGAEYLDNIWVNWQGKTNEFIDDDKIFFYGVNVDWCVTCNFNKKTALDSIRVLELFKRKTSFQCEVNLPPKKTKYINS